MARLEAKSKLLFYPTGMEIMALIASNLHPGAPGIALDPCAGTGEQLQYLCQQLNLTAYGNELHPGRAEEAASRLSVCLNGAREFLEVDGSFSLIFDNPPYDEKFGLGRMEVDHIKHDLQLMMFQGVGVWIIPITIVDFELCQLLAQHLQEINIRKFPDPFFEQFKQIVIFGKKRYDVAHYTYTIASKLEQEVKAGLPDLVAGEFSYQLPETIPSIERFELSQKNTAVMLHEIGEEGVHLGETFQTLTVGTGASIDHFQPVLAMTAGHTALAIAAGIVDGTEVKIGDQRWLIKGSTSKRIKTINETEVDDAGNKTQKVREREQLVQEITALNLSDGTLHTYNSLDDKDGFGDFLMTHQDALVQMIEEKYPPLFEPDRDMSRWVDTLSLVQAPGKLAGQEANGLLPAQQVRAAALATRLQDTQASILNGEMGVGKTCTAQAIAALIGSGNWKLVIVSPSQVSSKWAREAKTVLAQFGVAVHLIGQKRRQKDGKGKVRKVAKPVLDVQLAMEEPNPSILVMSYETAKNGNKWAHSPASWKRMIRYRTEVEEKIPNYPYSKKVEKVVTKFVEVLCCPRCGHLLRHATGFVLQSVKEMGKKKAWCRGCGEPLFQQVPFAYGGRMAIADLLNRQYPGQYYLILDEAHSAKGGDTNLGYAAMDLISGAKKVLAMTGTLYAGKASSIFYLLFRLFHSFRQVYDYTEVQRFIEHHGLQETITTIKADRSSYHSTYGYARVNERIKEIPGVSPAMVTSLLNDTAFLRLEDVGFVLPKYSEERIPIPVDDRLNAGLSDIEAIYKHATEFARKGNPGLLSAWLYASLGWVDCPVDEVLIARDKDGEELGSYSISGALSSPDELLDDPLFKDEVLLDLIEAELAEGRGVGVYFSQVHRRDWQGRVQEQLKRRGIYSEILRQSTCKAADREAWYQEFVSRCRAKGQEPVLLANGNLVKEGLDLVELPTLVEAGVEYRLNDLRQRDRRSWRLTQDRPVRVIFLYYQETMQETALQLVAAKLKAALMVEGNLADGLAAMDVDEESNLMDALMRAVSGRKSGKAVEWSGMKIAAIETVTPQPQQALPEFPEPDPIIEVEFMRISVDGNGTSQLGFADLLTAPETPATLKKSKRKVVREQTQIEYKRVTTKGGGEQFSFI